MRNSKKRGGNYILRALLDIEDQMRVVVRALDRRLFVEYWDEGCSLENVSKSGCGALVGTLRAGARLTTYSKRAKANRKSNRVFFRTICELWL